MAIGVWLEFARTIARKAEDVEGLVAEDGNELAAVGPPDLPHRHVDAPDGLRRQKQLVSQFASFDMPALFSNIRR